MGKQEQNKGYAVHSCIKYRKSNEISWKGKALKMTKIDIVSGFLGAGKTTRLDISVTSHEEPKNQPGSPVLAINPNTTI
mgnify:CR=1 FL=1